MAIAWDTLELRLNDYFEKGKDDKSRTYERAALDIENMYIDAVRNQGQDQFGNVIMSLNKFTLAISLRAGFKSAVDVPIPTGPSVTPPDIPVPKIDLSKLPIPNLDKPTITIPRLDLPELPAVPSLPNISISNLPGASGMPNLPKVPGNVPSLPSAPNVNIPSLPSVPNVPGIPGIPAVPSITLPPVPGMPEMPSMPKMPEIKFSPISLKLSDFIPKELNVSGLTGLLFMWSAAQLSTTIPPPGSVSVLNNTVVSAGTFPIMNAGSAGSTLAKELVNAFKQHIRTISGMTTALVSTGTTLVPVQFPWTGIS